MIAACAAAALAAREPYGVWGGLSESEREDILRARDRGARIVPVQQASAAC